VNGIWTSGIDSTVVDQYVTAKKAFVPVIGADNDGFLGSSSNLKAQGLAGAAVTNPPTVGGAGLAVAWTFSRASHTRTSSTSTPRSGTTRAARLDRADQPLRQEPERVLQRLLPGGRHTRPTPKSN